MAGWSSLFWRRECAIRCKAWMQGLHHFSGSTTLNLVLVWHYRFLLTRLPSDFLNLKIVANIVWWISTLIIDHTFCYIQSPEDSAVSIANMIRHHETEYFASIEVGQLHYIWELHSSSVVILFMVHFFLLFLQMSYTNLPDTTFKVGTATGLDITI